LTKLSSTKKKLKETLN